MNFRLYIFVSNFILVSLLIGCSSGGDDPVRQPNNIDTQLSELPSGSLSSDEETGILLMREEEKLARDTYDYLYEKWGLSIFDNISDAEQKHMDSMFTLIERYQLVDPIGLNAAGVFSNEGLQALYDLLIATGEQSLNDALLVGAEIEDVDIFDIRAAKLVNDNEDIALVYESLEKGSRNHMRSFHTQLEQRGITYDPKHLTLDEYLEIVNSPMETGP